ncbi:hypothetical protein GGP41_002686 [Bipolaris sorokiniana]|uniref:DUF7703 domain-containing protein n=2 Tax=Cochliobolus sativus TaxID=45130 RepID=A0A8H5ZH89_COCSA|nr:uncharacterized protein COCSADRAFT_146876 [Bipolaris sorokiniana ND90Pr]EMD61804.1 hypothetical protein COCSADRAFT_146876 [Bipolaris sorokiniana ND90Pr]KAF5850433.1 hypothetical protein GGP41_002686 [Bipolaris sorokiniana]
MASLSLSLSLSLSRSLSTSATSAALAAETTPAQGSLESAGAGITGGYTGNSVPLKIIIAFFLGLALYNALELIILAFVTFQHYHGLYFWSLVISAFGIIPYSLGFIIKFFRLLDPNANVGYVAVVFLTIGWYSMVTGQSVVLWSRLHLVTNSRRTLRWTLYMIICNGVLLHSVTTVLTFGSNSNTLSPATLARFVRAYSIMEKTQMLGFFLQETILSIIYIKETIRLLRLSQSVQDDTRSFDDGATIGQLRQASVRKTMYQLLAINVLIIILDLALLAMEFANQYLIQTTLKGVVYSVKLKLEFAVLGKLIQLVRDRTESDPSLNANPFSSPAAYANHRNNSSNFQNVNCTGTCTLERRNTLTLEKSSSANTSANCPDTSRRANGPTSSPLMYDFGNQQYPDFVDPRRLNSNLTHPELQASTGAGQDGWETRDEATERRSKRRRVKRASWIDLEMDKFNIE